MRFKITTLKSSLCNYSDAYILPKGKTTITGAEDDAAARQGDERSSSIQSTFLRAFENFP